MDGLGSRLAGGLLFAALLLSIAHGVGSGVSVILPGVTFWLAGLLLAARVKGLQRIQTVLMLLVGVVGLVYAGAVGGPVRWEKALTSNQALLAMLAGVGFLRLISLPAVDQVTGDPRGRRALWRTLLGVHLFGSVINLSAVLILGDRMVRRQAMSGLQATVLSRGFSLAAHWSPFFAAMGIALVHAPGASLAILSGVGLPLAALGLAFSAWRLQRRPESADFVGYPLDFSSLRIPGLLAALVMAGHQVWPGTGILTLIASLSLGLTAVGMVVRDPGPAVRRLASHVGLSMPRMSGELVLFLAAGVLAAGIGSVVAGSGFVLPLTRFGAGGASVLLVIMVLLSIAGVHPVISIATAHGLLTPLSPDPNLMGLTYLMAWAGGVVGSPLSGLNLALQARYGIDARRFIQWNGGFMLFMLTADVIALHLYVALTS